MASASDKHDCENAELNVNSFEVHRKVKCAATSTHLLPKRPYHSRRIPQINSYVNNIWDEQQVSQNNMDIVDSENIQPTGPTSGTSNSAVSRSQKRHKKNKTVVSDGPAAAIGQPIPTRPRLLNPPTFCEYCSAKKFQYESTGFCCSNGEVKIANNPFPPELDRLFTSREEDAAHYQVYSRLYNNLFAFSSLGGNIDCTTYKGVYVFRLHGQIYHYLPNLIPNDSKPKYLQLYFYDSHQELANRAGLFKELRQDILAAIMKVTERNPYARFFRNLQNLHDLQVDENTAIHINKNPALDQRVYNAPSSDEVAVILPDQSPSDDASGPYIVVHGKGSKTHIIKHYYGCYDPLQYPLLFPHGECGWHPGIPRQPRNQRSSGCNSAMETNTPAPVLTATDADQLIATEDHVASKRPSKKKRDVSCREYYSYILQARIGNRILASGRLLLQFIVDMYVKLENTRLDFLRNNQSTIRADLYQGILDTILLGEVQGANAGHRVILPPSFIGGPRDMRRRYLNAMQLVQKFGKPDIFATMTCNPNWPEIQAELGDGKLAQNRPDLLARVFRAKLVEAKKEIMERKVFGTVAAFIYVVEFQKRGLPHAHFLLILEPTFKIKCPEDFDRFVCAEIPSKEQPHLRALVLNHMMHGPCGQANPKCPCMKEKNGKQSCKANFPKPFTSFTTNKEDGYPMYQRRDTDEKIRIRGYDMDNRWVIPYNPYMLALFDCHFNVEICSTIQAVKYLYKYVYKGHDRISFNIGNDNNEPVDEIDRFQSGRWVSPPEAAWRIFGFDLYEMYPPVMPLNVHCEKSQQVHFSRHENLQQVLSNPARVETPLTEFFRINQERPDGPQYLYAEFPEHFIWDDRAKTWKDRKKGKMIGRLAFVGPAEGDRYYLRTLLANVRAPKSFEDLKTINGQQCAGFQEACLKRKLIADSNMTEQCLDEAVQVQMPAALRSLFVTLLIFSHPPNPKALWDQYYTALSEDFNHEYPNDKQKVLALTAGKIEQLLENMGKTLDDFGLQHLKNFQPEGLRMTRDIRDALDAPIPEQYIDASLNLNEKQKEAYHCIMSHIKGEQAGAFFIDGPGGTGKTYLYGALYADVRILKKIVLATASSGIAATGLPNGRTAHSRFKLPIDHDSSLTCDVSKQSSLAALLEETTLIIWDEAPMANKASIHSLDLLLRDLCDPNLMFGGKVVVLGGDFRQVLPIVPHKTQKEAIDASLVSSPLWVHFQRFYLTENMRAKEDPAFASFLLKLGDGKLQQQEQETITLPTSISVTTFDSSTTLEDLIEKFMPDQLQTEWNSTIFTDQAILTPKNDEVDSLNKTFIQMFPGEEHIYKSYDSVIDETGHIYSTEFLNTLCPGGMSPHELILKKESPVMLLRNLDPAAGLCNGTRLICEDFSPNIIHCRIATGPQAGKIKLIPRINLRPSTSSNYPFQFERKQFPLKLSFAMTINKAQGQTLNKVGVYLRQPCFSHGQLYVALSRARKASNIKVITAATGLNETNRHVKNIVSFEILKRAGILQPPA